MFTCGQKYDGVAVLPTVNATYPTQFATMPLGNTSPRGSMSPSQRRYRRHSQEAMIPQMQMGQTLPSAASQPIRVSTKRYQKKTSQFDGNYNGNYNNGNYNNGNNNNGNNNNGNLSPNRSYFNSQQYNGYNGNYNNGNLSPNRSYFNNSQQYNGNVGYNGYNGRQY